MTKPIIVVKIPCELLHIIQVKGFLIQCFNFLALPDISNNLQCCFCIGLALFKPGVSLPKAGIHLVFEIAFVQEVGVCVCVCVCVSAPWAIKNYSCEMKSE